MGERVKVARRQAAIRPQFWRLNLRIPVRLEASGACLKWRAALNQTAELSSVCMDLWPHGSKAVDDFQWPDIAVANQHDRFDPMNLSDIETFVTAVVRLSCLVLLTGSWLLIGLGWIWFLLLTASFG